MKCSSRRNCNWQRPGCRYWSCSRLNEVQLPKELQPGSRSANLTPTCLNEVQLPKELQRGEKFADIVRAVASMKCSSRRNCNTQTEMGKQAWASSLNEVQLPKELQRLVCSLARPRPTRPQ